VLRRRPELQGREPGHRYKSKPIASMTRPQPLFALLLTLSTALLAACGSTAAPLPPRPLPMPAGAVMGSPLLYRLPVMGTWQVQPTHTGNTHDQAYAFDMFMPGSDGKPFSGNGKSNTDWPAYGQPVVADAPGVVVIAVDGIPDNAPGVVNAYDQ